MGERPVTRDFMADDERALCEQFLNERLVRREAEDRPALDALRDLVAAKAAAFLGAPLPSDVATFLNTIHSRVSPERLNDLRLHVIGSVHAEGWTRPAFFSLARRALEVLVGNELVMQRQVNLSIQLPNDSSSLLAVHSDAWSGDSPFEVVLWVPWVDCARTKSMYFCDPRRDAEVQRNLRELRGRSAEELFGLIERDVRFVEVAYGQVLVFSQNVMHGNRVNTEPETRWSSNCRFKGAFTPYADKKLGEFFEPIGLRPATRLGLRYSLPDLGTPDE